MELLDDVCHMESRFALFADKKPFWTNPVVLLGLGAEVKGRFGLFGDSANLDAR